MFRPVLLAAQLCAAFLAGRAAAATRRIQQVYEFPNGTWVENLAARSSGQLLVTIVTSPDVYQVDPSQSGSPAKLIAHFSDSLATLDITELENDVFAVVRGKFSIAPLSYTTGAWFVSKIDLRDQNEPKISTIAQISEGQVLNGITTVEPGSKYLLIADSTADVVWRLNAETSHVDTAVSSISTHPTRRLARGGLGVNGIHTKDGQLYFTNSNRGFYRVPIHSDGKQAGSVVGLADFEAGDDFALDGSGGAYVARGAVDRIDHVSSSSRLHPALRYSNSNASELIEGNTTLAFGRTKSDKKTLYVTTKGGITGLVAGTSIQGVRVLALDLQ